MRRVLILLIDCYRYLLSPWLGQNCRFYPSCSCYARQAVQQHGVLKGLMLTSRRLLRCHPWHPGGYDPIPPNTEQQRSLPGSTQKHTCTHG